MTDFVCGEYVPVGTQVCVCVCVFYRVSLSPGFMVQNRKSWYAVQYGGARVCVCVCVCVCVRTCFYHMQLST